MPWRIQAKGGGGGGGGDLDNAKRALQNMFSGKEDVLKGNEAAEKQRTEARKAAEDKARAEAQAGGGGRNFGGGWGGGMRRIRWWLGGDDDGGDGKYDSWLMGAPPWRLRWLLCACVADV